MTSKLRRLALRPGMPITTWPDSDPEISQATEPERSFKRFETSSRARARRATLLLADGPPAPAPPLCHRGRLRAALLLQVDVDLDREHPHVDQRRPQAAGEHADHRAEQAHHEADSRDDEIPEVRNRFERARLVPQRQELLGDAQAVAELGLPVHDLTGHPADQGAQRRAGEQAEDKPADGTREHGAPDRKPYEVVVHHARRLTRDRAKIATINTTAGTANP